jgi:hypothetical protein
MADAASEEADLENPKALAVVAQAEEGAHAQGGRLHVGWGKGREFLDRKDVEFRPGRGHDA